MASIFARKYGFPDIDLSDLSTTDAYLKIIAEIGRLEEQIKALRALGNSIAPVSTLPIELLSKVFMHCCDLNESGEYTNLRWYNWGLEPYSEPPLDTRLVVSWVSRHWRNVALGHKPLWNLIFNADYKPHLDYARACVGRGQNLYIDGEYPCPEFLTFCASHVPQTCYFKIKGPLQSGFFWPPSAPLLHTLALEDTPSDFLNDETNPDTFPQLRSLYINHAEFEWADLTLIESFTWTLTKLHLVGPVTRTTACRFLNLLESLRSLIEVKTSTCLKVEDHSAPVRTIWLPRLQHAEFTETVAQTTTLVTNIVAPNASIFLDPWDEQGDEAIGILLRTLRISQGHIWNSIRHLQYGGQLQFIVSSSTSSPKHTLSIIWTSARDLSLPFRNLDLDKVESFRIAIASNEVMTHTCALPHLRTLTLESLIPLEFFLERLDSALHHEHPQTQLPALQELNVTYVHSRKTMDTLYRILAARKAGGVGLQKLVFFSGQEMEMQDVGRLREVVEDVQVHRFSVMELFDPPA